ncbi:MAG: hypothetical protein F6K17_10705 [Okeania sp. SIO3C4]|nr:hypothetical protein [Okeania sp. SIO3C4]
MPFWGRKKCLVSSLISCSVEYLHFGGRKALMLKAEGRREEKVKRDKVVL